MTFFFFFFFFCCCCCCCNLLLPDKVRIDFGMKRLSFSVAINDGSLYGSLGGKEEQPFERFNFLFGEFFVSFFLSSKIKRIY